MLAEKKPLVFGYVRVSTENQLENYSIDEQVERIEGYCKAKGWVLLKTYTDGGFSGGNTDRPALQQMIAAIRERQADAVVVYKLDRLSRSQKDTLTLIEDEFLANHADFVSINENFDTSSPFGRAMIGILSVFAQLEKDQITERFTMGRIGRGKAGYYHGGPVSPLGYDYTDGLLVVNEYQAMMVREIFQEFLAGKSMNSIWHAMEHKYPGKWSAFKIQKILTNSVYIGKVKFAKVEYDGVHQPIISKADFDAANHLLTSSARTNKFNSAQKTPFRADTLLSGILYCTRCGARYAGAHGCYRCYSRSKTTRGAIVDPNCKNDNWKIDKLNDVVVTKIKSLVSSPQKLDAIIAAEHAAAPSIDTKAVERRIKELDTQIEKLIDLYQVSALPMEALTRRVNDMNTERKTLAAQLEAEAKRGISPTAAFLDCIQRFCAEFDSASLATQRLLISSLIKRIDLDGESVQIHWRV